MKTHIIIILVITITLASGCKSDTKPIRLATYTYATNDRIDNLMPLAIELENLLETPVEVYSYPDVESFVSGIKANKVDIALINTLGYLLLSLDNEIMEPVATLRVKEDAVDNYKTVLLTNNDSIYDLKTLRNNANDLSMMFVAEGSTSGNLVPRLFLSSIGVESPETQFKEVKYGGNHTSTFNKLVMSESDICAIGSNEYFKQIEADSTLLEKTRLLWISDEIPLGPVLLNNRLSAIDKKEITSLFLGLHKINPNSLTRIKDGWSEAKQANKFHAINDNYYNHFRRINGNNTELNNILEQFAK